MRACVRVLGTGVDRRDEDEPAVPVLGSGGVPGGVPDVSARDRLEDLEAADGTGDDSSSALRFPFGLI